MRMPNPHTLTLTLPLLEHTPPFIPSQTRSSPLPHPPRAVDY
jgi:hypothetical protein